MTRVIAGLFVATLALGCGARTGLRVPEGDAGLDAARPDAGPPDAGRGDAGRPDAGPGDAGPDAGLCERGVECDDGLECTVDRCVAGVCMHEPCGPDERCVPGLGCARTVIACDDGAIHEIEVPTGSSRQLFRLPIPLCFDVARTTDGRLFVTDAVDLVQVDERGRAVRVQPLGVTDFINALAGEGPDRLLAAGGPNVYRFVTTLGSTERVASLPRPFVSAGDLVRYEGRWYLSAYDDTAPLELATLFEIDVATGVSRRVGEIGAECVYGLVVSGGRLFGLTCRAEIFELDPLTGAGAMVGSGTIDVNGAAPR